MKIGFVSLGCSKNLVDTEMMIGLFGKNGYEIVNNPKSADMIVINTCGFIDYAKEEGVNTILEMAEYKKQNCKYLIVTGCLAERYKEELEKEIPEIDAVIKFSEYDDFWPRVKEVIDKPKYKNDNKTNADNKENIDDIDDVTESEESKSDENEITKNRDSKYTEKDEQKNKLDFNNRVITTGENYAYVRIAEGCDNFCTFCAIPFIRGRFNSRKEEDILEEVRILTTKGIREIIIVAQDTTKYGVDIYGKPMLADLLHKIAEIEEVKWIRFLYSYPETITDDLIQEVKTNDKVCKYFDIPMQHIADKVLKKMNRRTTSESTRKIITKLREEIPGVIIRSTLMVGFPGETQEDFEELMEFVEWAKFDKLGAFTYSQEEGTAAAKFEEQIDGKIKKERYKKLMEKQQKISQENLNKKIGNSYEVLLEDAIVEDEQLYFVGRSYMDVPDVDGVIYIQATQDDADKHEINEFANCKITEGTDNYDLIGVFDD